jgi:hypothetical protein
MLPAKSPQARNPPLVFAQFSRIYSASLFDHAQGITALNETNIGSTKGLEAF